MSGKSIQFDFRITKYTSDEELDKYAEILKEKGPEALRRALEKVDVGRISPVGRTGNQTAVARKRQDGSETVITVVTARTPCRLLSFTKAAGPRITPSDFCR